MVPCDTYLERRIDLAMYSGPTGQKKGGILALVIISPYIGEIFALFALCGTKEFLMYAGVVAPSEALDQTRKRARIDLVDFGPQDCDQTHMSNSQSSITLVKSNGSDLISYSKNNRVTRGCLRMLR